MASKLAIAALVLLMVVGVEHGKAMPVRRGLSLGWMNGMKGGSPGGMQPSDIAMHAKVEVKNADEAKSVFTVPAFVRPPRLPPP
ncbi:hypothetical protein PVAP13_5KG279100 [Panicum virgatum]|uniref:Uncharacterized protein n=1 Tax=Panicum virgatum TaxID=38727 RepID=A0A8T0SIJ5_PANVG|nr:hypothetical protein PVAP13_5KG279100 [Panicum virgatum]